MRPFIHRRVAILSVVVVAASMLAALALTGAAPATNQRAAPVWLSTAATTMTGRSLSVYGGIDVKADLSGTIVKLYKREVGQNVNTHVGNATVTYNVMTGNVFDAVIPRLNRSCVVTASWGGNADYYASRTWMFAGVKPRLTITVPVATQKKTRVRIVVSPEQPLHRQGMTEPPFIADVQCRVDGAWQRFPGELGVLSTDGESWCVYDYFNVQPGTYKIRARFGGTNYNVASVSKTTEIVVP
jgi:hypothetical protein